MFIEVRNYLTQLLNTLKVSFMKRNYLEKTLQALFFALAIVGFTACDDDDNDNYPVVGWVNALSTKYENPSIEDRSEDGLLNMRLWNDNTLEYSIVVNNLKSGDELTEARLYAGDVLTNGNAILNLNARFTGGKASGYVTLRESLADSLMSLKNQIYININSQQEQSGLLRGQVNTDITYTSYISLSGSEEVPPVSEQTKGTAVIRMTTERQGAGQSKIYYQVDVSDVPSGDELSTADIHYGAKGETGDAYISLYTSQEDFGVSKYIIVNYNTSSGLYEDSYINVASKLHSTGLIRGQLKNDYENPIVGSYR